MIRFIVYGETPSKKNSKIFTRAGKLIPSRRHLEWHTDAMLQMNAQLARMGKLRPTPIDTPVKVKCTFYHGDKVRRDSDNQTSSIMDLLQDAKVLQDDKWEIVREISILNYYEKKNSRVVIEIENFQEQL